MPRPACAPPVLSAPLFIWKKSKIPPEFQTVWICRARLGPALFVDKKNDKEDAPTHPLTEIHGIAHERHTDPGPLTFAVFLFKGDGNPDDYYV